jgi:hypothetical protein
MTRVRAISVLSSEEHFEADRGVEMMKCDYKAQGDDDNSGKPESCTTLGATLSTINPT